MYVQMYSLILIEYVDIIYSLKRLIDLGSMYTYMYVHCTVIFSGLICQEVCLLSIELRPIVQILHQEH